MRILKIKVSNLPFIPFPIHPSNTLAKADVHYLSPHPLHPSHTASVSASINLPPSLFDLVPDDRPVIGVFFALYENAHLFPITINATQEPVRSRIQAIGSPVIAATVGPGLDFVNLDPPVFISLGLQNVENVSCIK